MMVWEEFDRSGGPTATAAQRAARWGWRGRAVRHDAAAAELRQRLRGRGLRSFRSSGPPAALAAGGGGSGRSWTRGTPRREASGRLAFVYPRLEWSRVRYGFRSLTTRERAW